MTCIVVVPDRLRSLGSQLNAAAESLSSLGNRLGGVMSSWDWESRHRTGVEGQVNQARSRANALAGQAQAMARYLLGRAEAFEQADGQGAAALAATSGVCYAIRSELEAAGVCLLPEDEVRSHLGLGQLLGGIGAAVSGVAAAALPYLDKFVGLSLKGKGAVGKWWPFAVDLRKNPFRKFKGGTTYGEALSFLTEFVSHPEDMTWHGAGRAAAKQMLEKGLELIPAVKTAMIVSTVIQLAGGVSILAVSESAKFVSLDPEMDSTLDSYASQARESLEKVDLGKPVSSLATLIENMQVQKLQYMNDTVRSMVQHPSAQDAARLAALTVPVWGDLVMAATDVKAHDILQQDGLALGKSLLDLGVGVFEAPFDYGQLLGASAFAYGAGIGEFVQTVANDGLVDGILSTGAKVLEQL
jgi:hypothetical protein